MPIGPFIQAGAGIIGQGMANRANRKNAEQQAQWNLDQWNRQNTRDDKLWNEQNAYNLDMWNMQNEYNSPIEQMARMKQAGINPHSIAGQGATNAQAVDTAQRKTQSVQGYNRAESKNVLAGINAFSENQRFKTLDIQRDNVKANTDHTKQNTLQEAIMHSLDVDAKARDNYIGRETQEYSIEAMRLAAENMSKDLEVKNSTIAQSQSNIAKNTATEKVLAQQILNGKSQILVNESLNKSRQKERVLTDWKIGLSKLGVTEKDPYAVRVAAQIVGSESAQQAAKKANQGLTKLAKRTTPPKLHKPSYRPFE